MVSNGTPYPVLIHTGRGGGGRVEPEKEERGNRRENRSQSWVGNTNMTDWMYSTNWLSKVYKLLQTPAAKSPFTGHFFWDDDIMHWLPWVLSFLSVVQRRRCAGEWSSFLEAVLLSPPPARSPGFQVKNNSQTLKGLYQESTIFNSFIRYFLYFRELFQNLYAVWY